MNRWLKKYGQFIVGALFLLYFLYTFTNALSSSKEVAIAVVLTLVLYIQSFGTFFYFYKKTRRPRLIDWLKISLFIMLVLNFMKIVNNADGQIHIAFSVTTVSLNDAPFTMLVIAFAFFALDLGYLASKFIKVKRHHERYAIKRKNWVFSILIFSTTIQGYLLFSGMSGYGSDLEYTTGVASLAKTLAGILNPFALIISAYIIFIEHVKSKTYRTIFYSALTVQILLGLLSGMKESALIPVLYVGIVFLFAGWKLPKNLLYMGLFVLALLYPVNNAYRNVINDPQTNTGSNTLNMAIALRNVFTKPLTETLLGGVESYGDRGEMYPYLQYSINKEPTWDYYKHMSRYIVLPVVWLIPRAIWPDKPRADIGGVLSQKIVGYENRSAVTPTNVGWAYFEGGVPFLILIFIMIGFLLTFIDIQNYRKPMVLLFYILLFHKSIKPEWDPYFMFASVIQFYIMYWLLMKIIGIKKLGNTQ